MPAQKMRMRAAAPYIQIWVFDETPKVGRKEGSQLDVADVVAAGELVAVGDVF